MRRYTLLLLLLSFVLQAKGEDSLSAHYTLYAAAADYKTQVVLLNKIAADYNSADRKAQRDSVYEMALETARMHTDNKLLFSVYYSYFENTSFSDIDKSLAHANEMLSVANALGDNQAMCEAYIALTKVELLAGKEVDALQNADKAFYDVSLLTNISLKARCLLWKGLALEKNNKKIEAFRNYMDGLYLAHKIDSPAIIYAGYGYLSDFYRNINNYDSAKAYKYKQFPFLLDKHPVDSLKLMGLYQDLSWILFRSNNKEGEVYTRRVIAYAVRNHRERLKELALTGYRSWLVENSHYADISDLYIKQFPEELIKIQKSNPSLYFRLKAYMAEANSDLDSAVIFYKTADQFLHTSTDNVVLSNFYKRYGQLLLRQNNIAEARSKMELSYQYAAKARYLPFIIEATGYLDTICASQQDFANAYTYARLNRSYADTMAMENNQGELLKLEVESMNRQQELATEREHEATERRHNLQEIAITIFIASVFVILAALGIFKTPKAVVESVGFFSFILLFEFIVMLFDKKIEEITQGEPWKILLCKIAIIAVISPLHHWMEHKVVHYLHEHRLIDPAKLKFKGFRKKPAKPTIIHDEQKN